MTHPAQKTVLILTLMLAIMFTHLAPASARPNLSDSEKREIIEKMYRKYVKDFPEVEHISAENALTLSERQQVLFVDSRKEPERAVSMIPNAITLKAFLQNPDVAKGKTVVVYCTVGYRSGVYADRMARQGITAMNLAGGILAWTHAGGKINDAQGETKRIHVFAKRWDYAPQGYETVVFGLMDQLANIL